MRTPALLRVALLLGVASSGCLSFPSFSSSDHVHGSAEYVWSSPQGAAHSGAVPLDALVCIESKDRVAQERVWVGDYCELHREFTLNGTPAPALSSTDGTCTLPTDQGLVRIRLDFATLGSGDEVKLAGRTPNGIYVSYRFAGLVERESRDGATSTCAGVFAG
jgi:hypothetical protein